MRVDRFSPREVVESYKSRRKDSEPAVKVRLPRMSLVWGLHEYRVIWYGCKGILVLYYKIKPVKCGSDSRTEGTLGN